MSEQTNTTKSQNATAEKIAPKLMMEFWTNPDGREVPTRDATSSEEFSLGMYEEDTVKGSAGNPYDCAIAIKAGDLSNVMLQTKEKRMEFGLKIGHTMAIIPIIDESSPVGYTRLRFHRRGEKLTKQFDDGKKVESTFVHFHAPTASQNKTKAKAKREAKKMKAASEKTLTKEVITSTPSDDVTKLDESPEIMAAGETEATVVEAPKKKAAIPRPRKRATERNELREKTHVSAVAA